MANDSDRAIEKLRSRVEGLEIPGHVAIIMDGNGRWAQERGLPRVQGHLYGRYATKRAVRACGAIGVRALSLYAFSAENWRRPPDEVEAILGLVERALREEMDELDEANVRFRASGRLDELPDSLARLLKEAEEKLRANSGMVLNLCVNYGGRAEIADAARAIAEKAAAGAVAAGDVDEVLVAEHLYQADLPEVDLLIRPGGEMRVSNFLLWQIAYAEIVVLPVLWPDFREEHLAEAIEEYNRRQRRFGGLGPRAVE